MARFELFPENLIRLRTGRDLTQADLGQAIRGGAAVISRLENGLRPTQRQVEALAQALGVLPEVLLGDPSIVPHPLAPPAGNHAQARSRPPATPMSFSALVSAAIAAFSGDAVVVMLPPSHLAYLTPDADASDSSPSAARIPTGRLGGGRSTPGHGQRDAGVRDPVGDPAPSERRSGPPRPCPSRRG